MKKTATTKVKLGDRVRFDVYGVVWTGTVVSVPKMDRMYKEMLATVKIDPQFAIHRVESVLCSKMEIV